MKTNDRISAAEAALRRAEADVEFMRKPGGSRQVAADLEIRIAQEWQALAKQPNTAEPS